MTVSTAIRWPTAATTPRAPLRATIARVVFEHAVRRVPVRVTYPDGRVLGAGSPASPELEVVRPAAFFARLGRDAKIGFGEAYMAGDWRAGPGTDLADLLTPFASRLTTLIPPALQRLRVLADRRVPHDHENTLDGSRTNIAAHYDLSNDLFAAFLDPTMTYSSAPGSTRASPWRPQPGSRRHSCARSTGFSTSPASQRHPAAGDRHRMGHTCHPRRAARCPRHHDHPLPRADAAGP